MRKKSIADAILEMFYLKVILKVTQENKNCWACSNGVTICRDTVSLIKHEIAKKLLQMLCKGLCNSYNTTLVTTSINEKAEKHESWLHIHYI